MITGELGLNSCIPKLGSMNLIAVEEWTLSIRSRLLQEFFKLFLCFSNKSLTKKVKACQRKCCVSMPSISSYCILSLATFQLPNSVSSRIFQELMKNSYQKSRHTKKFHPKAGTAKANCFVCTNVSWVMEILTCGY